MHQDARAYLKMSMGLSLLCEKFVSPAYRRPNGVGGVSRGAVPTLISQIPHFLCPDKSAWFGFAGCSPGWHFILISSVG